MRAEGIACGLQWSDFDTITMKQLAIIVQSQNKHQRLASERRSLEHYNAHMNAHRKANTAYQKMYPELERAQTSDEKPNVDVPLKLLEEVGIDVSFSC